MNVLVIGGGVFGLTASIALRERGHAVTLVDPGPLPHPRAGSTDISKLVRPDYGADDLYTDAMMTALAGWARWNQFYDRTGRQKLFHRDGLLVLGSSEPQLGSFEHESAAALRRRRVALTELDARAIAMAYPAWRSGRFVAGYLNPVAGWADAGRVIAWLAGQCQAMGVEMRLGQWLVELEEQGGSVVGAVVESDGGDPDHIAADTVVVAAGAWTPSILPELADRLVPVAQPIFYVQPDEPEHFAPEVFPPWCADIAETGWYGFPLHQGGLVKIANHGKGRRLDPGAPRTLVDAEAELFRAFVADALPELAAAPVVERKLCLYCDSTDGDFWITRHPERSGLVIAAGGSGHAFKFAPVLGAWTADVVEGRERDELRRFAWREGGQGSEAARAGR